ncbi:helix-turn-helix domain-containing protein [Enterococcus pseudoavium]|uniref:helix-turn-helix domain-containing protein n=1 Tax=Enterococcus pseudoavium TaxID=44007 RepID=UPI00082FB9CF|nr:helix-turn-helix domain-containing protein [Enterococcus pseudoavium]REC32407.1 helix-turn-helix domain-containing protein [Enterococcus pseudoavium]
MSRYQHLILLERERIFLLHEEGISIRKIGNDIYRSPSTISRELIKKSTQLSKQAKIILLEERTVGIIQS